MEVTMSTGYCNRTMTNNTDDDCWEFDDYKQRVLVATLCSLITMSGLFGNSLVIISVYISKKLRNPTNVFVVNLAIADLITCFFVISNVIALASPNGWPLAAWICPVSAGILMTCVGVSLYTLAVISYNRYVLITKTIKDYQRLFVSKRNLAAWLTSIWVLPIIIVNVPVLCGLGAFGYNEKYHSCSDESNIDNEHLYDLIIGMGLFPVPLVTVVVCYIRIYFHILKHAKKLATREDSEVISTAPNNQSIKLDENEILQQTSNSSDNNKSPLPQNTSQQKKMFFQSQRSVLGSSSSSKGGTLRPRRNRSIKTYLSKRQIEITKNLFYVLCAFLICITPYLLVLVLDDKEGAPFVPYAATILMFNSCINWVIYATKHPHFKTVFKCILLCRWHKIPEPIDFIRDRRWIKRQTSSMKFP